MIRNMTIAAIIAVAGLIGTPAAWAQDYSWGVFRENVPNVPDDQRNCWAQAMVAGETINGELLTERVTQQQAEFALLRDARRGLCASQRTSRGWSARQEKDTNVDWSNHDWSNTNGSTTNGSTTNATNPGP
jgi:hypothetical protein